MCQLPGQALHLQLEAGKVAASLSLLLSIVLSSSCCLRHLCPGSLSLPGRVHASAVHSLLCVPCILPMQSTHSHNQYHYLIGACWLLLTPQGSSNDRISGSERHQPALSQHHGIDSALREHELWQLEGLCACLGAGLSRSTWTGACRRPGHQPLPCELFLLPAAAPLTVRLVVHIAAAGWSMPLQCHLAKCMCPQPAKTNEWRLTSHDCHIMMPKEEIAALC